MEWGSGLATELRNLEVSEVSLVKKGANRKKIFLMKSAEGTEGAGMADENQASAQEPEQVAKTGAVEGLKEYPEEIRPGIAAIQSFLAAGSAEAQALVRKALNLPQEAPAPAPVVEAPKPAPEPEAVEPVLKSDGSLNEAALAKVDPVLRPQLVALYKAQAEAVEKAARLEEEKANTEAIAKAASEFPNLPAKASDLGPALRRVAKASSEDEKYLRGLLQAANAALASVVVPVGKAAESDSGSRLEQVQSRARALVAKGEFASEAAAFEAILLKDKDLYAALQAEKGK